MVHFSIVFLGCSPRSGSTLLTRVLDSHSKIASPCELAIPAYFKGDKRERRTIVKFVEVCSWYGIDPAICLQQPILLFDTILAKERKSTIILKDPRQSLFFKTIARDYPCAAFIHLVRDARSVVMSPMFIHKPAEGFSRWYDYNMTILGANIPSSRIFFLRYEDMVTRPDYFISALVNFLNYDFEPEMLYYDRFSHIDNQLYLWDGLSPTSSPWHTALSIGSISAAVMKKRQEFSSDVIEVYENMPLIQELNKLLGYDADLKA